MFVSDLVGLRDKKKPYLIKVCNNLFGLKPSKIRNRDGKLVNDIELTNSQIDRLERYIINKADKTLDNSLIINNVVEDNNTVICPYKVSVQKNKHVTVNFNQIKNLNPFVYKKLKVEYKELISNQLRDLVVNIDEPINIMATIYRPLNNKADADNYFIHFKFFQDALVELGCLKDDNLDFIDNIIIKHGGVDIEHPRVEFSRVKINIEKIKWS